MRDSSIVRGVRHVAPVTSKVVDQRAVVAQLDSAADQGGASLYTKPAVVASSSALASAIGLGILLPLVVYVLLVLLGLDVLAIMMVAAGIALLIRGSDARLTRVAPPETSAWLAVQVVPLLVVWIWRHGSLQYLGWVLPIAILVLLYLFSAGTPERVRGQGQGLTGMLTALIVAPFSTALRQMAALASPDRAIASDFSAPFALKSSTATVPSESIVEIETEPSAGEAAPAGATEVTIPSGETVQEPAFSPASSDQTGDQGLMDETADRAGAGDDEIAREAADPMPDLLYEAPGGGPEAMNEEPRKMVVENPSPTSEEKAVNEPDPRESPLDAPAGPSGAMDDVVALARQVVVRVEDLTRSQRSAETERIQLLERVHELEQELRIERERAQALPTMDSSITDAEVREVLKVAESAANQPETLTALLQLSTHSPLLARVARDYARLRGSESPAE